MQRRRANAAKRENRHDREDHPTLCRKRHDNKRKTNASDARQDGGALAEQFHDRTGKEGLGKGLADAKGAE
ncbi:hypothetical protein D3C71_2113430 [compost metagenome]